MLIARIKKYILNFKFTALAFLIGMWTPYAFHGDEKAYAMGVTATTIMVLLVLTRQIKII